MLVVFILSLIISSYMLIVGILNFIFFARSSKRVDKEVFSHKPKISVLIPARNEEARIRPTLDCILKQNYDNYEVLVLNDNSTDSTEEILRDYASRYKNFKYFNGKKLEDGWKGKPFALQQLIAHSSGDYILCIDADQQTSPDFLEWMLTNFIKHDVDCLAGWARHSFSRWTEAFITPGIYFQSTFLLPLFLIPFCKEKHFAMAVQHIMFSRKALLDIGGYAAIPGVINDDLGMIRAMKAAGYKTIFLDCRNKIYGKMYDGYLSACKGIKRAISDVFDKKFYPILILSVFMAFAFVFPVVAICIPQSYAIKDFYLILISFGFTSLVWVLAMINRRMPFLAYFTYPIIVLHIIFLAWFSYYGEKSKKGFVWKGRKVS